MSDVLFTVNFQPWVTVELREGGEVRVETDWSDSCQGEWLDDTNGHDEESFNAQVACAFVDAAIKTTPQFEHLDFDPETIIARLKEETPRLKDRLSEPLGVQRDYDQRYYEAAKLLLLLLEGERLTE